VLVSGRLSSPREPPLSFIRCCSVPSKSNLEEKLKGGNSGLYRPPHTNLEIVREREKKKGERDGTRTEEERMCCVFLCVVSVTIK